MPKLNVWVELSPQGSDHCLLQDSFFLIPWYLFGKDVGVSVESNPSMLRWRTTQKSQRHVQVFGAVDSKAVTPSSFSDGRIKTRGRTCVGKGMA